MLRRALVFLHSIQLARTVPAYHVHTSSSVNKLFDIAGRNAEKTSKELVKKHTAFFDESASKERNKEAFRYVVAKYLQKEGVYRRGHVEFIYAALERMKEYSVHKDIGTYRQLLSLFPQKKMVPTNTWQVEFMHYPKQQHCCIEILEQMEDNGVMPDDAMGYQLIGIFGDQTHAFRKYQRMMYWMPKFRNMNPYPVPLELPKDEAELAVLALQRMAVDLENKITVFDASELPDAFDHTFVASAQSPFQRELLEREPMERPLYVEGGFPVWMRYKCLTYFILRAEAGTDHYDPPKYWQEMDKDENLFKWSIPFTETSEESPFGLAVPPSRHEQEDGTILGMCITGTSSKDSVMSWVRFLQRENSKLAEIPVVFTIRTPQGELEEVKDDSNKTDSENTGQSTGYS